MAGAMGNPRLKLFHGETLLNENDDWGGGSALTDAFTSVGAFSLASPASKDAAAIVTLAPGIYSAQISGVGGATGVALVEVYELP